MKKISLICIAKNEDLYIQEWIDYHLKLGFDDIHIFQNDWRASKINDDSRVYLHEYDGKTYESNEPIWIRNIQAKCYNDFCRNYKNEYEWVACFDVDEFLVLKKTNDVKEFIDNYKDENCLIINWAIFGDNNKSFDKNDTSVINRFTKRGNFSAQFKSICKLGDNVKHQIHWSGDSWIDPSYRRGSGPFNYSGSYDVAQLNHYFTKTYDEFLNKRERGNACGGGINGKRDISDFGENNFNDVEDNFCKDFFNKKK